MSRMVDDYLQLIAAQLHAILLMNTARDLFGKPFAALGQGELLAVYNSVATLETNQCRYLTPETVAGLIHPEVPPEARQRVMGFGVEDKKG